MARKLPCPGKHSAERGHIVAADNPYGGAYNRIAHNLAPPGIESTFVNVRDFGVVEKAIRENTKAVSSEDMGRAMVAS